MLKFSHFVIFIEVFDKISSDFDKSGRRLYQFRQILIKVVGDYINTMKTTFHLSFNCLRFFFQITNLKVIKENIFNRQLLFASMFMCIHAV